MSRAFFPKIPKIRHGHFFDVTGIFSKNVTGTKKNVTGKKKHWHTIPVTMVVQIAAPHELENLKDPIKTKKVVGILELEKVTESDGLVTLRGTDKLH